MAPEQRTPRNLRTPARVSTFRIPDFSRFLLQSRTSGSRIAPSPSSARQGPPPCASHSAPGNTKFHSPLTFFRHLAPERRKPISSLNQPCEASDGHDAPGPRDAPSFRPTATSPAGAPDEIWLASVTASRHQMGRVPRSSGAANSSPLRLPTSWPPRNLRLLMRDGIRGARRRIPRWCAASDGPRRFLARRQATRRSHPGRNAYLARFRIPRPRLSAIVASAAALDWTGSAPWCSPTRAVPPDPGGTPRHETGNDAASCRSVANFRTMPEIEMGPDRGMHDVA